MKFHPFLCASAALVLLFVGCLLPASAGLSFQLRSSNGEYVDVIEIDPATETCETYANAQDPVVVDLPQTPFGRRGYVDIRIVNTGDARLYPITYRTSRRDNINLSTAEFRPRISNRALNPDESVDGQIVFQPRFSSATGLDVREAYFLLIYPFPIEGNPNNRITRAVCIRGTPSPNPKLYVTGSTNSAARGTPPVDNGEEPNQFESRLNFGVFNSSTSPSPKTSYFRIFNLSTSSNLNFTTPPRLEGAPEFSLTPSSFSSLAPRTGVDFEITFTPGSSEGTKTATMIIQTDDLDDPDFRFTLTAVVSNGEARLAVNALGEDFNGDPVPLTLVSTIGIPGLTVFSPTDLGEEVAFRFRMSNPGFEDLEVLSVEAEDQSSNNPIDVFHTFIPPFTIRDGNNDLGTLSARFRPTAVGDFQNTIVVMTDAPIPYHRLRITVYGRGVDLDGPPVADATYKPGSGFFAIPSAGAFFAGSINDTQVLLPFRVTNLGGPNLVVDPPTFSGDAGGTLSTQGFTSQVTLGPLESHDFFVVADPAVVGTQTASASFNTNTGSPLTFNVRVQGVNRPPDRPDVALRFPLNGAPFIIRGIEPGDEESLRFQTLVNEGRAPLAISSISVDSPFFRIDDAPTGIPAFGGNGNFPSAQFPIVFDPPPNAPTGDYRATVTVLSNDPDQPVFTFPVFSTLIDRARLPFVSTSWYDPIQERFIVYWHGFEGVQYNFETSPDLSAGSFVAEPNSNRGNFRGISRLFEASGQPRRFIRLKRTPVE